MPITGNRQYQQILTASRAAVASEIQDLVSDEIALLSILRRKGSIRSFSGPEIRVPLQIGKQTSQWAQGYDILANPPVELFNSAVFSPSAMYTPISFTGQEMRANEGANQIFDVVKATIDAAKVSAKEEMEEALFSDGTGDGGKQIIGLAGAVPTVTNTGTYGGISRADNAIWRTSTFDADTDFPTIGTQVNATTIRPMLGRIMTQRSRGMKAADLFLMSPEHYEAYDAATTAIQRITRKDSLASLGFASMEYVYGGRTAEIVLAGGIGSSMPANTTYGLDTDSLALRYREGANFDMLFNGEGQMPINQDAMAQFIMWEGALTMSNPLFNWKLIDSDTAS